MVAMDADVEKRFDKIENRLTRIETKLENDFTHSLRTWKVISIMGTIIAILIGSAL